MDNNKTTMDCIIDAKKFWTIPQLVSMAKDVISHLNDGIREF